MNNKASAYEFSYRAVFTDVDEMIYRVALQAGVVNALEHTLSLELLEQVQNHRRCQLLRHIAKSFSSHNDRRLANKIAVSSIETLRQKTQRPSSAKQIVGRLVAVLAADATAAAAAACTLFIASAARIYGICPPKRLLFTKTKIADMCPRKPYKV